MCIYYKRVYHTPRISQEDIFPEETLYSGGFATSDELKFRQDFDKASWMERYNLCEQLAKKGTSEENDRLIRLSYFGFDYEFDDSNHIVLRKIYKRLDKIDPSKNFIISLDRVGLFGKNLKIYKFRSMYPYSEFLHNSLLNNENLSSIGKIEKDPRITNI